MTVPMPALLPSCSVRPATSSPSTAPRIGPKTSQRRGGGMKNPIKAPMNAPTVPFQDAPNLRAPHALKTKSAICPISISRPAMITIFQVTESSGPIHRRWVITPTQTINVPGTIGSKEPNSPSMKITEQRPSAVYSISIILIS